MNTPSKIRISSGLGFQCDLVPEALKALDQVLLKVLLVALIEVVDPQLDIAGAIPQEMIGNDQNGAGNGHSSALFATAGSKTTELGPQVVVIGTGHGMSGLNQKGFEMRVAFGGLG